MRGLNMLPFAVLLAILLALEASVGQEILSPSGINIAQGKQITATATCGVGAGVDSNGELFCELASVPGKFGIKGQKCDRCIPSNRLKDHSIKYAIDGTEKFWQSPPLSRGLHFQKVNITINLGQEYQVAYVIIKTGNAPRPGIWALEKSLDGRTFTPWQYFATSPSECQQYFGKSHLLSRTRDDSVICTTEYSNIPPFENGEIHISLVQGRPGATNFSYSSTLQHWTRATYLRLRLLKVKTLLADLLPLANQDKSVTRRYYYSIKDISVGAICMCNGHADICVQTNSSTGLQDFRCTCRHNTCGARCDRCCDMFVQKKWRPASPDNPNECEACNCHGHSSKCYYDDAVAKAHRSLDLNNKYEGGGVCEECQHNTAGINCERCKQGFFRPRGVAKTSPYACRPCNCNPAHSTGRCYDGDGDCECKPRFGGPRCDRCREGFYGFPNCRTCDCNPVGTTGKVCGPTGNRCPCKTNFDGAKCDRCAPGYFGYPDCRSCNCDRVGAYSTYCDPNSGQCRCRQTFRGRQCNTCNRGFFNFPECKACNCDYEGTAQDICDSVLGRCVCMRNFAGPRCDVCNQGYYRFPECKACECSPEGAAFLGCDGSGTCRCKENYVGDKCRNCKIGYYGYPRCIKCACDPRGAQDQYCDPRNGQCRCKGSFRGLNCNQCRTGYYGFPDCRRCQCNPAGIKPIPGRPLGDCSYSNTGQCDCKDNVQGLTCSKCKPGYYNLRPSNPRGCDKCDCEPKGVVAGLAHCDQTSGQCTCKENVVGMRCTTCKVGFYELKEMKEFGCSGCSCDVGGSFDQKCDSITGQCKCRPNVGGRDCTRPTENHFFPDLLAIRAEMEDGCVPGPQTAVGGDVPGLVQNSPPQGDQAEDCSPARFGFNELKFPGYSWRGYAEITDLQKTIKVKLDIPHTGRYHVVLRYALNHSKPVMGEVELSPRTSGVKQSSRVIFSPTLVGSTVSDGFTTAGEGGKSTQFMLTKGEWDLTFRAPTSNLLVDYVSAVPQQYYEAYILKRKVTNPCIVNGLDTLCTQYSYMNTIRPDFPKVELETGYIITRQGRQQTHVFDDKEVQKQLDFNAMAWLDSTQTRVTEDVSFPKPGNYLLVIQYYHPVDRAEKLDVYLRSRNSQQRGIFHLHSCKYRFGCRQVALDPQRRLNIFRAQSRERRVVTLLIRSGAKVAVDSITAIPVDQWDLDFIIPKPLCTTKNNKCISTSYPSPKGATKFEVASDGSPLPPNILDPSASLRYLQGRTTFDIIGRVPSTGRYAILLHYYQPKHISFNADVTVTSERAIPGSVKLGYCPNVAGCRALLINRDGTSYFDIGRLSTAIQLAIPQGYSAWIDYALLIPEDKFSDSLLNPNPVSFAKDFVADCGKNEFYIKPSSSGPCARSAFSLSTDFNNKTLPCKCNTKGALSDKCQEFAGQCECRPNVIGRQCNRCKTGYFGFPNCRKCQCVFCNEVTGACDCPPNTVGANCELCLKGTYGYDPILGCRDCKCDRFGVAGGNIACNPQTGQCPCKPSHTGRRCDQCAPGYHGYPYCQKCDCDARGVNATVCDVSGRCLCKSGVTGNRCEKCASGYFNLDVNNPAGCSQCWCSDLSSTCTSSSLQKWRIRAMDGWTIENSPATVTKTGLTSVSATISGQREDKKKPIYWVAPAKYIGKKIYSYGGLLTYLLRYTIPVEVVKPVLTAKHDAIIEGKDGVVMFYKKQLELKPGVINKIDIQLIESDWAIGNKTDLTRAEFMNALLDVRSLKLRASYSTSVAESSLSDVLMDSALLVAGASGQTARAVEKCVCPPQAAGDSCEFCGNGYTRSADKKTCISCQCNGHSNDCHHETGQCYNCQHNTTGDRCQFCVKGYYGNSTKGTPQDCQLCKCPLGTSSNSFATECSVGPGDELTCVCKEGYTGRQCDQCADGYYGDPTKPGDYCKKCQCNGNIDSQIPGSCDPYTGECLKCINKAAGDHCERCLDGYYGDAVVAKNCAKCECSACGAVTSVCNHANGACQCKASVVGSKCSLCKPNTWNFASCLGCEDCDCANASRSQSCDVTSGQCDCKAGSTGRRCERCQAGFWNYKPEGCQACNCPGGADNLWGFCDVNTGQCCKPGGNCTICPHNYILTPTGCEYCGECVGRLLRTAQGLDRNVTRVLENLKKGAAGLLAEGRFRDINSTLQKLIPPTNKYSKTMKTLSEVVGISVVNKTAIPRPFARYPLDQKSSGRDTSGNNRPAAMFTDIDFTEGPPGTAGASFMKGISGSYIKLANTGSLDTRRSTSFLLWVQHEGQVGPIFSYSGIGNKVHLWLDEASKLLVRFSDRSGGVSVGQSAEAKEISPNWYHVGAVYDYQTGTAKFYLDGVLADEGSIGVKELATDSEAVYMGAQPDVSEYFKGAVSCLQIFDQALSGEQIVALKGSCESAPTGGKSLIARAGENEDKTNKMEMNAKDLKMKASETAKNATESKTNALILEQDIRDALNRTRGIVKLAKRVAETLASGTANQSLLLEEAEAILKELQNRDFSALNKTVNMEVKIIASIHENAVQLLNETVNLLSQAKKARELIEMLRGKFGGLLQQSLDILKNASMAEQWNDKSRMFDSETPIMKARAQKEKMEKALDMVQGVLKKASDKLMNATNEFQRFNGSFGRLDDLIQQVYDRFANLTSAINELGPLASRAYNHSMMLKMQADALENLLRNTSRFAEKAVNASRAYTNIKDRLNEALEIAREADGIATEAQRQAKDIGDRVKVSNMESMRLVNESTATKKKVDDDLQGLLDSIKDRIARLKKKIMTITEDLGQVNGTFDMIDAYGDMGSRANAAEANATRSHAVADDAYMIAKMIEDQLPVLSDLKNSIGMINKNITNAERDVGDAVNSSMNIKERIEIIRINQTRIQNELDTEVLDVIREIQYMLKESRGVLNQLKEVMDMNNNSISMPVPPPQLREPSLYKDIQLFIKPRVTDALIMYYGPAPKSTRRRRQAGQCYLGDFIALQLKDAKIRLSMCISGQLVSLETNEKIKPVAKGTTTINLGSADQALVDPWYRIHATKIGSKLKLMTQYYYSNKGPSEVEKVMEMKMDVDNPVLRFDVDSHIIVGGVPEGVRLPAEIASSPFFVGAIDSLTIDHMEVGLWNAENLINPDRFYKRLAFEVPEIKDTARVRMLGNGYLASSPQAGDVSSSFSFSFKTFQANALLLMAVDHRDPTYFNMVELLNGTVKFTYNLGLGVGSVQSKKTFNDGRFHKINRQQGARNPDVFTFKVTEPKPNDGNVEEAVAENKWYYGEFESATKSVYATTVYFGGLKYGASKPKGMESKKFSSMRGCFQNPYLLRDKLQYSRKDSIGYEDGCVTLKRRMVTITAPGGYLAMAKQDLRARALWLSFSFRTDVSSGVLISQAHNSDVDFLTIGLLQGKVMLKCNAGESTLDLVTQRKYNDGEWHFVYMNKEGNVVTLSVDNEQRQGRLTQSQRIQTTTSLYIGGASKMHSMLPNVFTGNMMNSIVGGSIRDLSFKGELIDLSKYQKALHVSFVEDEYPEIKPLDFIILKPPTKAPGDVTPTIAGPLGQTTSAPMTDPMATGSMTTDAMATDPVTEAPVTEAPMTEGPTKPVPMTTKAPTTMGPTESQCSTGSPVTRNESIASFSSTRYSHAIWTGCKKDPVLRRLSGRKTKISIQFRAANPDGILLYSAKDSKQADFIACYIVNGKAKCVLSCGIGILSLTSTKTYNDGKWHTLLLSRKIKETQLVIDGKTVAKGNITGSATKIDGLDVLHVGGVPEGFSLRRIKEKQAMWSFPGCLKNLQVFSKNPTKPPKKVNVRGCVIGGEERGVYFTGKEGSYLKVVSRYLVGTSETIFLEIRPQVDTGVIMSAYSATNKDFLVLELIKGDLVFRAENGNGPFEVRYSPRDKTELCDGTWHRVSLKKIKNTASIQVDDSDPIDVKSPGALGNTNVDDPLYIGGVPEGHKGLKTTKPFKGCIRGFVSDGKKYALYHPQGSRTDGVFIGGCPT